MSERTFLYSAVINISNSPPFLSRASIRSIIPVLTTARACRTREYRICPYMKFNKKNRGGRRPGGSRDLHYSQGQSAGASVVEFHAGWDGYYPFGNCRQQGCCVRARFPWHEFLFHRRAAPPHVLASVVLQDDSISSVMRLMYLGERVVPMATVDSSATATRAAVLSSPSSVILAVVSWYPSH